MIWHSNSSADVLNEWQVDPLVGLTDEEVNTRLEEYGENRILKQGGAPFRQEFSRQLRSPLSVILLIVAGVVLIIDLYNHFLKSMPTNWIQPIAVAAWMVVICLLGALRHSRARAAIHDLHTLSAPETRVRRGGTEQVISTYSLVPGDIVLLAEGDIVPADCRLIETNRLK